MFVRTVVVRRVFVAIYGMHLHWCSRLSIPTNSTWLRPLSMAGGRVATENRSTETPSDLAHSQKTANPETPHTCNRTHICRCIYICVYTCMYMYVYVYIYMCSLFIVHRLQRAMIVARVKTRDPKPRSNQLTEHSYTHASRAPDERCSIAG